MLLQFDEIVDNFGSCILLEKMKREIQEIDDVETLRQCVLTLVDLNERQKGMFKQMLYQLDRGRPRSARVV